jgi:hypothetical protein
VTTPLWSYPLIDLSTWNLTIPQGSPAITVETLSLQSFSNSFFQRDGSTLVFWAPVTGSHYGSSHFPRSEMRETDASGQPRNWRYDSGTNTLQGKVAVTQVPSEGKVVVAQIHARNAKAPLVKIQYRWAEGSGNVDITYRVKPGDSKSPIAYTRTQVPLGQAFNYSIRMTSAGEVIMLINGQGVKTRLHGNWQPYEFFFKAGNYTLDNTGYAREGGRVIYYALRATHHE